LRVPSIITEGKSAEKTRWVGKSEEGGLEPHRMDCSPQNGEAIMKEKESSE
jgi:hypothetical protein